ncbi:TRAP transporter large permease [Fusobacterium necrophorum]|uniref:Membrane protein n=1 Tax=Fusobacterium necrophorum DJ-2 TaxID=1441737 RepID=A0AB73C433_9FUSO|nr:TRAP transporter large permease [Fusobacterium necrophorum]KDE64069.1 membrane protein [Fusobacterium necrophorum DJ-1]KDE72899.1 membrane protein [Fusobacterium necrophorum DJ-2]MBR8734103.1 C4-dicarboxylate TRAP transporter large permease protein DctM [Fusobacterium necrophorum]MBR8790279.1 C4-dicarboxylate TRAP transporter large permease protein DctM [Fusobacterium necrophorum]MBR8822356.1 C4-dicarboxylate TRAP transporter large permease protein DctM [Fusobacterium necrophorum]
MDVSLQIGIVIFATLIIFLAIGVPISISIGFSSSMAMLFILPFGGAMITSAQRIFIGVNSFSLLAIPFFILAGNIMNNGGIAIRLINCAKLLGGKFYGPLAQANVVANMFFGAISGSGVAAAAAVGGTIAPIEEKEGYDKKFCAAVNISSAPTGMLIPPSNTLIVYSTVAGSVSVSALFIAGYIPGILWGLGIMLVVAIIARKLKYKTEAKLSTKFIIKTIVDAIPSLLLVIIVIGGILKGIFTATEGSAVAVVYSLVLSFFYKELKLKDLPKIFISSAQMTAIVIFMIGVSSIMSWVMAFGNIPQKIAGLLFGLTKNYVVILIIMNVLLLIIGTFMDPTPAVLIFTPIFLPIVESFGMSPIHFGIMLVFNLCIGTITPPVGPILFTGCKIGKVSIEEVFKFLIPFYLVTIGILFLVTFIPKVSLLLPQLFGLLK